MFIVFFGDDLLEIEVMVVCLILGLVMFRLLWMMGMSGGVVNVDRK